MKSTPSGNPIVEVAGETIVCDKLVSQKPTMTRWQRFNVWIFNATHYWRQKCPACGRPMICVGFHPGATYHRCPDAGCKYSVV